MNGAIHSSRSRTPEVTRIPNIGRFARTGALLATVVVLAFFLAACGSSNSTLTFITVIPATASIAVGGTQQYMATGTYSNGSTQNITSSVTWSSGTTTTATITTGGFATGVAAGASKITATSGSITGTALLTVTGAPTLISIAVTPANASIAVGGTQQFTATGTYSDGSTQNVNATATWNSSTPTVATISSPGGLATAVSSGTTTIMATCGTVTSPAVTLTVAGTDQGSNGTLDGQYVFSLNGTNVNGKYILVGSLTADGNGNITTGEVNFGDEVNRTHDPTITGTYAIGTNGIGTLTLTTGDTTFGINGVSTFIVSMVTPNDGLLVQQSDSDLLSGQGEGRLDIQTPADFNASFITGAYSFTFGGVTGTGTGATPLNIGGVLTADGVSMFSNGTEDVVSNYVVTSNILAGTFAGPDTNGYGTATLTPTGGTTATFAYYLISGNALRLIETDTTSGTFQQGNLSAQGPTPMFTDASLSGSYVFVGSGTAADSMFSIALGGLMTADGAGNIISGIFDSDDNGTVTTGTAFTGTYTVNSNGRGTITNTAGIPEVAMYFTADSSVLFLEIDGSRQLGGRLMLQKGAGTFTASSLSGNYALAYHTVPPDSTLTTDVIGQIMSDGVSALTGIVDIESAAIGQSNVPITGSYTAQSNGRFAGTTLDTNTTLIPNLTATVYLVSSNLAVFISQDTSEIASGTLPLQQLTTPGGAAKGKPTGSTALTTVPLY